SEKAKHQLRTVARKLQRKIHPNSLRNPRKIERKSIPRRFGQYSVGIAVKEYRDGQLLSTVVRDFQFNVIGCSFDLISAFVNPIQDCDLDVEFENKSQGATNYFWDFGDLNSLTDTSTLSNPSYKYPGTGTYQIKLIATSPTCSDTFYKTLRVNPDTGDFAGVDVRSCNGEPIIIGPEKHQKNASYNWSPGHLVSDSTKRKTMVVPTKSFQVILTQRFGYCLGYDSVNILFGKPSLALTIDTFDECEKRAYQFKSEKEGDSITWRLISDDGIEVYNGKKWIKQFKSKGNYQLTMMAKINDECTDSLTESLKIQFDSLNFLGLDKSICFGDSVLIGDTFNHTNVNYTWFPKSKFDDTTISILFVKPKYNAVYWLKKSSKNCELIDTLKIEVDKPEPDFKIAYDAPCDGSSVTFYNESENCENYYWDFGKNNGELPVTTKDSVNVEYNQNKTYTIALRGISQKGCSFTKNKELNIANDTAFFAGTDTSLCKGDSIYIGYFDSISYTIFMWYKNDTFLNYAKPKIKVSPYDTAEYVLLKKYSDCTFADTVKVDVENPKAIFSIDYEPECDVFEVPILNRSKGIKSRFWLFINQDSSHAEFTKTRLTLTQGEGIYDLSIVVYSNNCTDTFNEQLIAYLDTGVVIQSDSTLCLGDSIELSIADTNKNANYLWLPNQYLNSNTISNPTAKPTTSIEYLVKRSFEKCVYTKTIDLNVVNPKASFDTIISPDCFGYKVDFKNLSTESNQYLWTFNNDSVSDNLEQTVVFNYGDSINANLTAINEHCASEFSISDFKDGYTRFAVTIPNIFTPNDDDRNDCFKINVPALPKDCNNYGLAIYNRWGQMVFSNKNLKGDFCWDGTNQPNSAHLQSGVYFYIIDILDRKYTGSVHLIR
ncbi:MAG: gliding motility-associated C-terminal domain-containing protein, partial [Bacteroidia bacterium]